MFKVYYNQYVYSAFSFLGAGIGKFNYELGFDFVVPVDKLFVPDVSIDGGGGVSKQFHYKLHVNSLGLVDDFKGRLYWTINGKFFREYDKRNEETRYIYNNSDGYERVSDFHFVSFSFYGSDKDSLTSTTFLETSFLSYLFRYKRIDKRFCYGTSFSLYEERAFLRGKLLRKGVSELTFQQILDNENAEKILEIFVSMRKGVKKEKSVSISYEPIWGRTISGKIAIVSWKKMLI